jgi:ribosome biogenesis GTPase
VLERRNYLPRPSIANVDQAILVFARQTPDPDYNLLDRLLVQIARAGIDLLLVFTKIDLIKDLNDKNIEYYRQIGYRVVNVSNKTGEGLKELPDYLTGKISVLAGPSGVGKSSLLNSLEPGRKLKTGLVSDKIGRGKHTTRHVELLPVAGGLVADTPGFSSLYLPEMKREELQNYFPEFDQYKGDCKFKSCLHDKEPACAVKEALEDSKILPTRYEHYLQFLQEVIAKERRF